MVPNPIRQPCKNNSFRCLRGGGLHVPTPEVFPENRKKLSHCVIYRFIGVTLIGSAQAWCPM